MVGESGSGKTITALSILRLLPQGAKVVSGEIIFEGKDILKLPRGELTRLRGRKIVYIPQDPANSLDPRLTVGSQLKDAISLNHSQKSVEELLSLVKITKPLQRAGNYPHELSGGMKQRILIAMALVIARSLVHRPKILIADEPTTALDVTVQAQILDLLRDLTKSLDFSTIFITHNLGIVAEYADRVVVMKKGEVIEENNVFGLFSVPRHEYTKSLIESVPRIDREKHLVPDISSKENILSVSDLSVHFLRFNAFGREISRLRAVDEVSFSLKKGESVGLVGESGCGKTTIARAVLRVISRNNSQITARAEFEGQNIFTLAKNELPKLRRNLQLIIQENATALNPRKSAGDQIMEVFLIHGIYKKVDQAEEAARNLMDQVGVPSNGFERFPAEFSSGERQRLILARALALQPKTLFLDEPVASLDVSVQAKILELLGKLQSEYNLTYLFISHDLSPKPGTCFVSASSVQPGLNFSHSHTRSEYCQKKNKDLSCRRTRRPLNGYFWL